MSYSSIDHAAWVESNILRMPKTGKPKRDRYGTAVGAHAAPAKLSSFEAKVMDILGMVYGGIYNAPICWERMQWKGWGHGIGVPTRSTELATTDGRQLTWLVLLCHEARIRCEIRSNGPRGLLLAFWQRAASGGGCARHPNIDEVVKNFRSYLPADHRIIYRESSVAEAEAA